MEEHSKQLLMPPPISVLPLLTPSPPSIPSSLLHTLFITADFPLATATVKEPTHPTSFTWGVASGPICGGESCLTETNQKASLVRFWDRSKTLRAFGGTHICDEQVSESQHANTPESREGKFTEENNTWSKHWTGKRAPLCPASSTANTQPYWTESSLFSRVKHCNK